MRLQPSSVLMDAPDNPDLPLVPPPINPLIGGLARLYFLARRPFLRRRIARTHTVRINRRDFVVTPGVMDPVVFRTGRYFAEQVPALLAGDAGAGRRALDVGTGCGVLAAAAADSGFSVTATDISPEATACARANMALNGLEGQVAVIEGDLFAPVAGQRFDLVMASLPKFRGTPANGFEVSWRSPDVIDRFAAGLSAVLAAGGMALVLLTTHGDDDGMLAGLARAGLEVTAIRRRHFGVEIFSLYRVTPGASR